MSDFEVIVKDLRRHFGNKVLLSLADIAPLIGKSPDAQYALIKRNSFPIPHTKLGRQFVISIYDLARYLAPAPKLVYSAAPKTKSTELPHLFPNPLKLRHPGFAKRLME